MLASLPLRVEGLPLARGHGVFMDIFLIRKTIPT